MGIRIKETPQPKIHRLYKKQIRKIERYAGKGKEALFVRAAIDAFEPKEDWDK